MKNLWHEAWRVIALLVVAVLVLKLSPTVAAWLDEPYLSTFGMYSSFLIAGIGVGHVVRIFLFPTIRLGRTAVLALQQQAAGLVFLGVCIVIAAIILAMRPAQAAEPPAAALPYLATLQAQQRTYWPDMPAPSVLAAQVEQETCITLKHRSCWNPRAELKTPREYGFGLGQVTVTARFNVHTELRQQYASLDAWTWENRYDPVYQLRALVLKDRGNFQHNILKNAATAIDRLAFMLSAYNGGLGGIAADRRVCKAKPGCDAGRWFGHVEETSYKARLSVPGYGKSFFTINREYVRNVLLVRRDRYRAAMGET